MDEAQQVVLVGKSDMLAGLNVTHIPAPEGAPVTQLLPQADDKSIQRLTGVET